MKSEETANKNYWKDDPELLQKITNLKSLLEQNYASDPESHKRMITEIDKILNAERTDGWQLSDNENDIICNINNYIETYTTNEPDLHHRNKNVNTKNKKKRIAIMSITFIVVLIIIVSAILMLSFSPSIKYNKAVEATKNEHYSYAKMLFEELDDYKDSKEKINEINYLIVLSSIEKNGTNYGNDNKIIKYITDGSIAIIAKTEGYIEIQYEYVNSVATINTKIMLLPNENIVEVESSREIIVSILGNTGANKEFGDASFSKSTYNKNSKISSYNYSNTGSFNNIMDGSSFDTKMNEIILECLTFLNDFISSPEISLTMSDLGFYEY